MGAVKNHFHDEICAAADAERERDMPDEPEATTASSEPRNETQTQGGERE